MYMALAASTTLVMAHNVTKNDSMPLNDMELDVFICRLKMANVLYMPDAMADKDHDMHFCETESYQEPDGADGMVYLLHLSDNFIQSTKLVNNLNLYIAIPGGKPIRTDEDRPAYIDFDPMNEPFILSHEDMQHRGLNHQLPPKRTLGVSTLLVLRVSGLDRKNEVSKDLIHGRIFGVGNLTEEVAAVSQFDKCSWSKFNVIPAVGPEIDHGVGDLDLNLNIAGMPAMGLQNILISESQRKFGPIANNFDHVAFCLPQGLPMRAGESNTEWLAYAYVNRYDSYFNGELCVHLTAFVHELGHNLGLTHASIPFMPYADTSGYMGFAGFSPVGPAKCFNAVMLYYLRWYEDTVREIDLNELRKSPWGGWIYGIVDRDKMPEYGVNIVKVADVFVSYNRAISFNRGSESRRNEVNIHENRLQVFDSRLVVRGHKPGNTIRNSVVNRPFIGDVRIPLRLELCEIDWKSGDPDYVQRARYSIHFDYQQSTCNVNLFSEAPSAAPTKSIVPSVEPSLSVAPTVVNSASPSFRPSISFTPTVTISTKPSSTTNPSLQPSVIPSMFPSNHPSISIAPTVTSSSVPTVSKSPSVQPTVMPSKFPSSVPSIVPTQLPSTGPSPFPTEIPTVEPSIFPSLEPSADPTQTPTVISSTSPSLVPSTDPTQSPSALPSLSQSPSSHCEDNKEDYFWDDEILQRQRLNCFKLAKDSALIDRLCYAGHPAYDLCEDTCGKCNDKCEDAPGTFLANRRVGYRSCKWLIGKPGFQKHLCKPGTDAFKICGETCNSCEVGATSMPSAAPQTSTPTGSCEDTNGNFLVSQRSRTTKRNCLWLSRSRVWQGRLCVPSHDAYQVCPELCGACTDNCHDSPGTFTVAVGLKKQTCKWLSVRPNLAKRLCVPSHPAYELCAETCNTC